MNTNVKIEKSPSLAEVKLKYKNDQPIKSFPEITSPEKAEQVLREIWDTDSIQLKEEFVVLLLNNAKRLLGWSKISSGGGTATIVDPASVFQVALLANATSIILAHNHPSGNLKVSKADKNLTHRIKNSGNMLGISVEDHIILTADGYISLLQKGIL
ncbi:JAB domain-containing protein [Aliifodinibius salicampi]|uniref:JAB domain-containing protein n=1 Tax=Fodinibius salicampi TaxID=1920655 RepID=A0ABT3PXW9_9BACT|nr:JAB domain-containing protein [Fodinibius salicampi]MCW9712682.1 JAB domain-containing protein [Fodinibius salicampi]